MSNIHHHRRVALLKRPPLVRSSSPMTTYCKPKKSVRFCDNESLENVRLFLKTQMPKACRSDPNYPLEYNYQLRLSNWPAHKSSRTANPVKIEHIELITKEDDTSLALVGTCQVANLAFEKHVVIRYSLDHWVTVKEVNATFKEPVAHSANTWDRFGFKIVLNSMHHAHETLYLAVKYTVSGREFWDNNDNKDYKLDIVPHIQLQEDDLSSSSSSSDDEEDDENTFDDCSTSTLNNNHHRHPFDKLDTIATKKPTTSVWSPPLSPTTPVDTSPLWINSSITNNKSTFFTDTNYHELLRKYCFNRPQQNVYSDPKPIQF